MSLGEAWSVQLETEPTNDNRLCSFDRCIFNAIQGPEVFELVVSYQFIKSVSPGMHNTDVVMDRRACTSSRDVCYRSFGILPLEMLSSDHNIIAHPYLVQITSDHGVIAQRV